MMAWYEGTPSSISSSQLPNLRLLGKVQKQWGLDRRFFEKISLVRAAQQCDDGSVVVVW